MVAQSTFTEPSAGAGMHTSDNWLKQDSENERARRNRVSAMRKATNPFLDALFEQITKDLNLFVAEFPEYKDALKINDQPRSIWRRLGEKESLSVRVRLDFIRGRLSWQYSGEQEYLAPGSEVKVTLQDGSLMATADLPSLSRLILRPVLFPELVQSEREQV